VSGPHAAAPPPISRVSSGRMGMALFLFGDAVTFTLLIVGHLYLRRHAPQGAPHLDLSGTLDTRAGSYSTGMRQKIVIARAVIHDPPVLVLDEAASGLDVLARRALLDFVKAYRQENRLVVYSTHVMSEVEEVCDRVAVLERGELLTVDTVPGLLARTGQPSLERAFFALMQERALSRAGRSA